MPKFTRTMNKMLNIHTRTWKKKRPRTDQFHAKVGGRHKCERVLLLLPSEIIVIRLLGHRPKVRSKLKRIKNIIHKSESHYTLWKIFIFQVTNIKLVPMTLLVAEEKITILEDVKIHSSSWPFFLKKNVVKLFQELLFMKNPSFYLDELLFINWVYFSILFKFINLTKMVRNAVFTTGRYLHFGPTL